MTAPLVGGVTTVAEAGSMGWSGSVSLVVTSGVVKGVSSVVVWPGPLSSVAVGGSLTGETMMETFAGADVAPPGSVTV